MQKNLYEPNELFFKLLIENQPAATANITGNDNNKNLHGIVNFFDTGEGLLIEAEIYGLPNYTTMYSSNFYGFHIHEFGNCTKPFDKTGSHLNPNNANHPNHIGDMPPLLGNQGFAYMIFFTNRLSVDDIIGKSVVIHDMPDDFTTQPAGNSGNKIGCGVIVKL